MSQPVLPTAKFGHSSANNRSIVNLCCVTWRNLPDIEEGLMCPRDGGPG